MEQRDGWAEGTGEDATSHQGSEATRRKSAVLSALHSEGRASQPKTDKGGEGLETEGCGVGTCFALAAQPRSHTTDPAITPEVQG